MINTSFLTIEEINHGHLDLKLHPHHVDQGMTMLVSPQKVGKERAGCDEDHLVGVKLLTILAGQGHISGVFVLSQFLKRRWQATFKEKQISATTKKARDGCTICSGGNLWRKKAAELLQLKMTGGTPEVRSDKSLTLLIFEPMDQWTNGLIK